ncbi:nuclear transport factor 2 family protein [Natronosalvus halobius]|uniref:nuclear transport factor 2 family protein n=1 Tax=Natronosalvus halobius TaxID=2953746 RepID=UPI00209E626F|nr:nuclear transport factor 2 family protein [Natronosalvus halobius]USZ73592.1 nuclear transport factor 2 family protein [Natronosalvus halobius]
MDHGKRNELIDEYFRAMDEETFADFADVFADDVEYRYPSEQDMHGVSAVREFFEEHREHSNSTHKILRRVADESVTVCEGTVTADRPDGGTLEAAFVDVFEFDDEVEQIDHVGVYTRA